MTEAEINKLFEQATRKALVGWETNLEFAEITNELWSWYLSRPSVRETLERIGKGQRVKYVRRHVFKILSGDQHENDLFDGRSIYSSDSVKDALLGTTTNRYLVDILPMAMRALSNQNEGHAEAIRNRYDDGIVPPKKGGGAMLLARAVKSLTEHVNIIAFTAGLVRDEDGNLVDKEGPGSKHAIFPDNRKVTGEGHSDPTANIALMLIEHPELRDDYLYESPLPEFLGGRCHAQPA